MAFIIIWPGFYSRSLNIRVYIIQYFYPSIASPPPPFKSSELPRSPGNYEVHPRNSDYSRVLVTCKIDYSSNAPYLYRPPVSIHVKCYILGLYACKSLYRRLFKNSYAFKCFLYVGLNFHLGERLPSWRKIIICKALKKETKHECFLCKKKLIEEAIIVV